MPQRAIDDIQILGHHEKLIQLLTIFTEYICVVIEIVNLGLHQQISGIRILTAELLQARITLM